MEEVEIVRAYILIETSIGKTRDVAETLKGIEGIKSIDVITGPYDIILIVKVSEEKALGNLVTNRIQTVPDVVRTITCITLAQRTPNA